MYSHYSLWRALQAESVAVGRRAAAAVRMAGSGRPTGEKAGSCPIWFLADPRRTDLALIDPQARRDVIRYRWAVADRPELGGIAAARGRLVSDLASWLVCG